MTIQMVFHDLHETGLSIAATGFWCLSYIVEYLAICSFMIEPAGRDHTKDNHIIVHVCKDHTLCRCNTYGFQRLGQLGHALCQFQCRLKCSPTLLLTLLSNQLEDKSHHAHSVLFPQDHEASRRVVRSERSTKGYGWSKFISYDKLDFDATLNCQYLKDDCPYFQIEVQTAKTTKP